MRKIKGIIQKDGDAYIAVELVLHMINLMIAARDEVIDGDENKARFLVPGSDAAATFMSDFLNDARYQFFAKENLDEQFAEVMEGIDALLKDQ